MSQSSSIRLINVSLFTLNNPHENPNGRFGGKGVTRTHDTSVNSRLLWPTELHSHILYIDYTTIFYICQVFFWNFFVVDGRSSSPALTWFLYRSCLFWFPSTLGGTIKTRTWLLPTLVSFTAPCLFHRWGTAPGYRLIVLVGPTVLLR